MSDKKTKKPTRTTAGKPAAKSTGKPAAKSTKKPAAKRTEKPQQAKKPPEFPQKFPFWARLKISKKRTTLVIDEDKVLNKKTKKMVDGYVHREATHTQNGNEYEEFYPNPDIDDPTPMFLKRPSKLPKSMFKPHNKILDMPDKLKKRYDKNNKKKQ